MCHRDCNVIFVCHHFRLHKLLYEPRLACNCLYNVLKSNIKSWHGIIFLSNKAFCGVVVTFYSLGFVVSNEIDTELAWRIIRRIFGLSHSINSL